MKSLTILLTIIIGLTCSQVAIAKTLSPFDQGKELYKQGKYEVALVFFERAFKENPLNSKLYFYLGNIYNHKKMFKKKWDNHPLLIKEPYEKNNRMYVTLKRTYKNMIPFLLNNIPSYSLGKHIEKQINNKFLILKDKDLLNKDLQMFWTTYFDGKEPWER